MSRLWRLRLPFPQPVEEESKPVASPPEPAGEDRPGSWGTNWGLVKPPEPKKPDSPFRKLARAGGSMGVADELWGTEENGDEEQARAVLLTGSFSAYVHCPSYSFFLKKMTHSPGGGPYSSIVAQMKFRSLRSNHKVSINAPITSVKRRYRPYLPPARRRAYTFWLA